MPLCRWSKALISNRGEGIRARDHPHMTVLHVCLMTIIALGPPIDFALCQRTCDGDLRERDVASRRTLIWLISVIRLVSRAQAFSMLCEGNVRLSFTPNSGVRKQGYVQA